MSELEIEEKIAPIITGTYGDNGMARALVAHLAPRLADEEWDNRGREHFVLQICWMWFAGGTTAENVASRIEEVLSGHVIPSTETPATRREHDHH